MLSVSNFKVKSWFVYVDLLLTSSRKDNDRFQESKIILLVKISTELFEKAGLFDDNT